MKIARLADGSEIHFPEDTSDEIMDKVVREHLQKSVEDSRQKDLREAVLKIGSILTSLVNKKDDNMPKIIDILSSGKSHVFIKEALDSVALQISRNAIPENIDALTRTLHEVAQNILSVGEEVMEILRAPREIITDKNGIPIKLERVDVKQ